MKSLHLLQAMEYLCTTGGSLHYLQAPLTGNKERSKGPSLTQFAAKILKAAIDSTVLHFIPMKNLKQTHRRWHSDDILLVNGGDGRGGV